jgi:DNA-3-methyladenine glycosylase
MLRLSRGYFSRDTLGVARDLLGQRLVRVLDGVRVSGRIVEVEAYVGEGDQASHARCGRTARNAPMYGPPGHAYVYFIYGMHHCLNVVTEREGYPAAVLLRALEPLEGIEGMRVRRGGVADVQLTNGPARLCQALEIDRRFDGADLCAPGALLFLEEDEAVPDEAVASGPRIGVRGDEAARAAPWRFYVRKGGKGRKGGEGGDGGEGGNGGNRGVGR